MRSGIIGFILGIGLMVLALVIYQRQVSHDVRHDLAYDFDRYVFDGPDFPKGYLEQGRLVHRCLFPSRIHVAYYDADYHEVTQADRPGRYGAVVRMDFSGGVEEHRFVTLYHTAAKVFWWETPWPLSAQLPSESGIDAGVVRTQEPQIDELMKNTFIGNGAALAILLAGLSETSPGDPPAVERTNALARDTAWWFELRQRLGLPQKYPYLVDLPRDYDAGSRRRWPVILYLHSAAEVGYDLRVVRESGLARVIADGKQLPAIVVSPQRSYNEDWVPQVLSQLLDEVSAKYRVDPDRIYVTGASAGGDETWSLALAYPDRLAAIVPICGEGDPLDAARLKNLPIWVFHGARDESVPLGQSVGMVEAIRRAGGHPHLTILPNGQHNVWDEVYAMDSVYTWLLAQRRGRPEVVMPSMSTP